MANRLTFTPFEENGKRGYRFEGEATYGGLLARGAVHSAQRRPHGTRQVVGRVPTVPVRGTAHAA